MMKWTDKQLEIIEERNKNILVSAAAGSGKTAVLVERIKQLIIKDQVSVDNFLITTFTNAAAAEMKERLEKAIRDALKEPDADREYLNKQLRLMPRANISTFHSFTIEVMKRYYYLTDLEPGVKIGDETQIEILKRESVDELFDRRFDEDYCDFTEFLKKYSSHKEERTIKGAIVGFYDEMRSIPYYMEWAREKIESMSADSPVKEYGLDLFFEEQKIKSFEKAYNTMNRAYEIALDSGLEKIGASLEKINKEMHGLREYYDNYGQFPNDFKYSQVRATKEEKEEYELVKGVISSLLKEAKSYIDKYKSDYSHITLEESDMELKAQKNDLSYLMSLVEEYEKIFAAKKAELVIVDFDDVMHYAINILDQETAAAEYRDKFKYIFIDEYQDCNQLQETIAEKICRGNNLFMVGDLKQSIYRFRLAEPELFRRRYEKYKGEEGISKKIDLNSNFRSKSSVTKTVNEIFEKLMPGYDENAKLHCTVSDEHPGMDTEVYLIDKEVAREESEDISDAEAALITKLIREHIGKTIYDTKKNENKTIDYGDIVILTRGNASGANLERYLNNAGIPAQGEAGSGYFDTIEIQVFVNILKIINNTRQDVSLISAMKSVAFDFSVTELAQIRTEARDGSYYSAVKHYAENGSDEQLKLKVKDMLEKIEHWKQLKNAISLEEFVKMILWETGYYDYCSGLPLGNKRIANLRLLVEKAAAFEKNNYSGLHGFLAYIEAMQERNIKTYEAKTVSDNENAVRIMTIHKSKGLEFPIVILAGIDKRLGSTKGSKLIMMHKDYGISIPYVNREEGWHKDTLLAKAISAKKAEEGEEEEVRVLYVALTRGKDKLILTGQINNEEALDKMTTGYGSYLKMIYPILEAAKMKIYVTGEDDFQISSEAHRLDGLSRVRELLDAKNPGPRDEELESLINDRFSYKYPYEQKNIRTKYSVSQLNKINKVTERTPLNKTIFSQKGKKLTAAEIGTAMHTVMERVDFASAVEGGAEYIAKVADKLVSQGLLNDNERKNIDISNIWGFFASSIGKRAAAAKALYKEREFILNWQIEGVETTVQGVIDCYFEEDDGLVLIDYKNSYVGSKAHEEDIASNYREQINLYKNALEEATGNKVKESYLYLFTLRKFIKIT